MADIALLKVGRHFRFEETKIIVGRNEAENNLLTSKKSWSDYIFEVPDIGSPITLLKGPKTKKAIKAAAALTAFYSDAKSSEVKVTFGREKLDHSVIASTPTRAEVEKLRI